MQAQSCGLQEEYRDKPRSVIAADFYHANELLPLSDEEIVQRVHRNLVICEPAFAEARVSRAICIQRQPWRQI